MAISNRHKRPKQEDDTPKPKKKEKETNERRI